MLSDQISPSKNSMTNQMPPRSRAAIRVFQQNVSNETNSRKKRTTAVSTKYKRLLVKRQVRD